jgi:ABC-type molybdate transport system substrate-binding protein
VTFARLKGKNPGVSSSRGLPVRRRLDVNRPHRALGIASGEAEIGVQQVAELRPVAGVDQFAELPPELQKQIPYSAGIAAKARDAATARALVSFLRSQPALEVLKRKGMDLP